MPVVHNRDLHATLPRWHRGLALLPASYEGACSTTQVIPSTICTTNPLRLRIYQSAHQWTRPPIYPATHARAHTHARTHTHTHKQTYTRARTHTHTHTRTYTSLTQVAESGCAYNYNQSLPSCTPTVLAQMGWFAAVPPASWVAAKPTFPTVGP
jgi:hypothetical protein